MVGHHLNPLVCHSSHNDLLRSYCALFWKLEIQFGWWCGFERSRAHYSWTSGFLEGRCTDRGRNERALLEKYEWVRKQDWARKCLTPQGRQAIHERKRRGGSEGGEGKSLRPLCRSVAVSTLAKISCRESLVALVALLGSANDWAAWKRPWAQLLGWRRSWRH